LASILQPAQQIDDSSIGKAFLMPQDQRLLPSSSRTVFFVSDGTGITAETFGHSVLTQFDLRFRQIRLPFIDTCDKAYDAVRKINDVAAEDGTKPIVFSTLVKAELSEVIQRANAMHMDLIQTFVAPLEQELGVKSTHTIGRSHNVVDSEEYKNRIEAINFSLAHDDGQSNKNLSSADVILVGVSRSGKTPTSLYLAMQYGVKAANYPLIPDDFERGKLPSALYAFKSKIFGLSIEPQRLSEIRNERRAGSKYASLENCRYEVNEAEAMMRHPLAVVHHEVDRRDFHHHPAGNQAEQPHPILEEVLPVVQPGRDIVHRHRAGDVITLGVGAAQLLQEVPILLGFHADSAGAARQAARQAEIGFQHRADGALARGAVDEAAVDLQFRERDGGQ
jgi:regulator of PEP synthase PpsR (kinase-PPPase family)